ncbi:energy transducer TonB [Polynucleobacter brandtiae]|uniref:TonB family protein n=1 Tax=Polynucleobacter brandtiae TaxID=1938816 RepID=A0A2M8VZI8_9BURK|nr:energy transducer TonB [Polynucleobacter brandtiae]PJI83268.1 TonB family protein [Polynucleobacter brandtiae]
MTLLRYWSSAFNGDTSITLIAVVTAIHLSILGFAASFKNSGVDKFTEQVISLGLTRENSSKSALRSSPENRRIKQSVDRATKVFGAPMAFSHQKIESTSPTVDVVAESTAPAISSNTNIPLSQRGILANPQPPYPIASRRMGEQGFVELKMCINHQGLVDGLTLVKSSGFSRLDHAALETIKEWRFSTLGSRGSGTPECYRLPIHFTLET